MSNPEDIARKPFTKGWELSLTRKEALPIKKGGKLLTVYRSKEKGKQNKREYENEFEEEKIVDVSDEEVEVEDDAPEESKPKKKEKESLEEKFHVDFTPKSTAEIAQIKEQIADICSHITSNPEGCFSRSALNKSEEGGNNSDEEDSAYHIQNLLDLTLAKDAEVVELALLSTAIIFKDICPSYRIRNVSDKENTDQMKKETYKLMSYEKSLLAYYQKYINILEKRVTWGLGTIYSSLSNARKSNESKHKKNIKRWNLGFIAFTCQCELLRSLNHFNFRSILLSSITLRIASERDPLLVDHGCNLLKSIFAADHSGEISYEFVMLLSKTLKISKYLLPSKLLELLEVIKVTVHANDSKAIHKQVTLTRKKRRKIKDEIELGLLEANANTDELNNKRFQVNSLQEIALIYFRILKAKVGFRLMPTALRGLSRITHLIDIDTVIDLMAVLHNLLDPHQMTSLPPIAARLLCIHCALITLSGPGQELKINDEYYLLKLKQILREMPKAGAAAASAAKKLKKVKVDEENTDDEVEDEEESDDIQCDESTWKALVECLELSFVKKREERAGLLISFIRLLFLQASQQPPETGIQLIGIAHTIMIRYPRVRQQLHFVMTTPSYGSQSNQGIKITTQAAIEDDRVEDLAMRGLISSEFRTSRDDDADEERIIKDGTWIFAILKKYIDPKYPTVFDKVTLANGRRHQQQPSQQEQQGKANDTKASSSMKDKKVSKKRKQENDGDDNAPPKKHQSNNNKNYNKSNNQNNNNKRGKFHNQGKR